MKKCKYCGTTLMDTNWFKCFQETYTYICKECNASRNKAWRKKNHSKYRQYCTKWRIYNREYMRNNMLFIGGKTIKINKRSFLGFCELCGQSIVSRPQWHHWNDKTPEKGLWLDWQCHQAAEAAEKNGLEIPFYEELKELIEELG